MRSEHLHQTDILDAQSQKEKREVAGSIPNHVAIIMDGNRRWAEQQGIARIDGHRKGLRGNLEPTVRHASRLGISELTIWALSTGNWKRGEVQMSELFQVFRESFDDEMVESFVQEGARVRAIGRLSQLPEDVQERIREAEERTKDGKRITVNFALNYGGREEIIDAINKLPSESIGEVTEDMLSGYMYVPDMNPVDLLIRSGGEQRTSGFMLWESPYAEIVLSSKLWPDFSPDDLDAALEEYAVRERRFGGNKPHSNLGK